MCADWQPDLRQGSGDHRNQGDPPGCAGGDESTDRKSIPRRRRRVAMNAPTPLTSLPITEGDSVVTNPLPLQRRVQWKVRPAVRLFAVYMVLAALIFVALRNVPLHEIGTT